MKKRLLACKEEGQTAIEYMILLAVVTAIVMVSFNTLIPKTRNDSEAFFNQVMSGVAGEPPRARSYQTNYP